VVTFPGQFDKPASPLRALVIDDDLAVRTFVDRVLREAGYQTMVAKDGLAARNAVLESGAPDFVVTDQSMPGMSGHEFAGWLRQRHPAVKVLYLSGYVDPAQEHQGEELWEKDGYLEKPCTVRGLLQAVSLLLFRRLDPPATSRPSRSL